MNPSRLVTYFLFYLSPLYERATDFLPYLLPLGVAWLVSILTWIRAFSDRWISYTHRRHIIREALESSLNAKDRLSSWSSHNARSRPISMKFHKVWQDPDCKVMEWYRGLSPTSTKFRSIRHCRENKGPFYHEFLEIELNDGHICRIERMGEGVHADAVRWTGCTSHDIIQCFAPDQYRVWLHTSKRAQFGVVNEVTFPDDFDLKDILAICYTIQRHTRARNYTLQSYNCYFLCCTILSILARRIVSWEKHITQEAWRGIRRDVRNDLSHYHPSNFLDKKDPGSGKPLKRTLPLHLRGHHQQLRYSWLFSFFRNAEGSSIPLEAIPPPAPDTEAYAYDVRKYLTVGICSLLNPESPEPEEFLLASLMSRLNEYTRLDLTHELSRCLWQGRLEAVILKTIKHYVWASTGSIKAGTARNSERMARLLGNLNETEFPREESDFLSIRGEVQKGFLRAFLKICRHHIDIARARYNIEAFEGRYPLWKQFGATILGLIITVLAYPAIMILPYLTFGSQTFGILREDLVILDMCRTFRVSPRVMVFAFTPRILARQVKYYVLGMFSKNSNQEESSSSRRQDAFEWCMQLAYGWAEELVPILEQFIRPEQLNIPAALAFLNSVLPGFIWEDCLLGCVSKKMNECVRREIGQEEKTLEVRSGNEDPEKGPSRCTLQEFQNRIFERIKVHAKRVDNFQLAEELVVESGMANAMSEIWASLPIGFGGVECED